MIETITDRQFEIIQATSRILTSSGVGGLTIKNLAKEMKFTESAIYRHFPSKEKIILTMLDFLANDMDNRFTDIIANKQSSEVKFYTLFHNQFAFFNDNPHFVVAVFSDGLMEESEAINAAIFNIMNVKMKHLKPIIQEGQSNGFFINSIAVDDLLNIIMGSMRLQMYKWRVANFDFDILKEGTKMVQTLLALIKTKSS